MGFEDRVTEEQIDLVTNK
jgi:hypothetical protein